MEGNDMTGNSTDLPEDIDDDGAADPQALHIEVDSPVPGKLANANDARRRLENYWEEKALEEM